MACHSRQIRPAQRDRFFSDLADNQPHRIREGIWYTSIDIAGVDGANEGFVAVGGGLAQASRGIPMTDPKQVLAVFIDFENVALGLKDPKVKFDIERVLARLVEKGNIVVKRAYADWSRFGRYTGELHEAAIELIEIPKRHQTGKNSADIRLCVDAMDLCYSKGHINTFVIVSGDSDFSPLVSKLKENGRTVIGVGMEGSTSDLLRDNCDEYIYYEDLQTSAAATAVKLPDADEKQTAVFSLLLESLEALRRENREVLWSSMIKETMKRKRPSFNEAYYGYKTFSKLLEAAADRGLIKLHRDAPNRTYIVTQFGGELQNGHSEPPSEPPAPVPTVEAPPPAEAEPPVEPPKRSRRSRRKRTTPS